MRLGVGEPAPQERVLGLQGLDMGFEDEHKPLVLADGRGLSLALLSRLALERGQLVASVRRAWLQG